MKKALVILSVLGLAAAANAEVRIFFTVADANGNVPGTSTKAPGLANPANWNKVSLAITSNDGIPTNTDNKDFSTAGTANFKLSTAAVTYNAGVPNIDLDATTQQFVYAWVQFYGETVPGIRSWQPGITKAGVAVDPAILNPTWYKQDNMGGNPAKKRWDGASTEADNYATFRSNPQTLAAAGGGAGISNSELLDNGDGTMTNADAWNLYRGDVWNATDGVYTYYDDGIHTRISLLGSFRPTEVGQYSAASFADIDAFGTVLTNFVGGSFTVTPEPASMLLLGLAGLLIRRR